MGSSPIIANSPVAQLVERLSDKQEVIGSIPIRTIYYSISLTGRATSFEVVGYRFESYIEYIFYLVL